MSNDIIVLEEILGYVLEALDVIEVQTLVIAKHLRPCSRTPCEGLESSFHCTRVQYRSRGMSCFLVLQRMQTKL